MSGKYSSHLLGVRPNIARSKMIYENCSNYMDDISVNRQALKENIMAAANLAPITVLGQKKVSKMSLEECDMLIDTILEARGLYRPVNRDFNMPSAENNKREELDMVDELYSHIVDTYGVNDNTINALSFIQDRLESAKLASNGLTGVDPVSKMAVYNVLGTKSLTESSGDSYMTSVVKLLESTDPHEVMVAEEDLKAENLIDLGSDSANAMYRHTVNKLNRYPSYIRRVADSLAIKLDELDVDDELLLSSLSETCDYMYKVADRIINETTGFEYDMIIDGGYENLFNEGAGETVRNISATVREKSKIAKHNIKRTSRKMDNKFQRMLDDYRDARKEETEEELIKSTVKLSRYLKKGLTALTLGFIPAIGPVASILYLIVNKINHDKTKHKYRQELTQDLKDQREIVEIKYEKAKREGNTEDEIRLKKLLQEYDRALNKIRYNTGVAVNISSKEGK